MSNSLRHQNRWTIEPSDGINHFLSEIRCQELISVSKDSHQGREFNKTRLSPVVNTGSCLVCRQLDLFMIPNDGLIGLWSGMMDYRCLWYGHRHLTACNCTTAGPMKRHAGWSTELYWTRNYRCPKLSNSLRWDVTVCSAHQTPCTARQLRQPKPVKHPAFFDME